MPNVLLGKFINLLQFCENNRLASALVTTIDVEGERTQKGIRLIFIPAAVYAYVVGNNTLEQKLKYGK